MNEMEFHKHRVSFRELMIGKSLAEVRASRNTLLRMSEMTEEQILCLVDDLLRLEEYKTGVHSTQEEHERIVNGFYGIENEG